MRKIISISLVCITVLFTLMLTGCSFDTKDIMEGIQKIEQMEQEAKETKKTVAKKQVMYLPKKTMN